MSDTPKHPDVTWAEEISDTVLKMTQCERGMRDLNTGYWGHAAYMLEKVAARADVLERENADLHAKLEAATKNDERYRWLRDRFDGDGQHIGVLVECRHRAPIRVEVDEAIDAAIAQGKGGGK